MIFSCDMVIINGNSFRGFLYFFSNFYHEIKNQFGICIHVLEIDNAQEFLGTIFYSFHDILILLTNIPVLTPHVIMT